MRWRPALLLIVATCLSLPATLPAQVAPESIVSGLSQNRVSITADFDGSEILIYGAVKRTAPAPDHAPLDVIITVEGPSTPLVVRRKERRAGIWINRDKVWVDAAPSFYAVASTGNLDSIVTGTEDLRHAISIRRAIRAVGISADAADSQSFIDALIRIRSASGAYRVMDDAVELTDETLFRADVLLPSNLTEGDYKVRLFLVRDRMIVAQQDRSITVRKEGLERMIFNLARQQPLIYGLLSLVLAAGAGWAASAAFRMVRL